ncbi:hypothetical protein ACIBF5_00410 [Micromonospora sp. NPDC050417]|uniref:hypothetical protein n=1 Tax=Micromonospora sp. NPDC050417 TaxID=3364280 RepID=UPI00378873BE
MNPEEQHRRPQPYELAWAVARGAGSIAGATAAVTEARGVAYVIAAMIIIGDMVVTVRRHHG